jgi:hypothetical protein
VWPEEDRDSRAEYRRHDGAGRGSSSTDGGGAGAAKTCTAGHTQATINGRPKCLAAGQTCSSKAISQYPQYGHVCLTSHGRLTLRRQ